MKLAYVTEHSTDDVTAFSGIPHFMSAALRQTFETVHVLQAPAYSFDLVKADPERGRGQLREIGAAVSDRLRPLDYDIVLCQGSSMIPFLRTDRPIVLWHDSVLSALTGQPFDEFRKQFPLLHEWDRLTLERVALAAFAAEWQIEHVKRNYGTPPEKLMTLPFGANLAPESAESVRRDIRARGQSECRLTFLGIDWERKGLHLAYEVMCELNRRGIDATLDVIGCSLPRLSAARRLKRSIRLLFRGSPQERVTVTLPNDGRVRQLGFLRKDEASDVERIESVLRRSHFMLHPASFECFGIALAEANAFGVPVITTAGYGPDTIVRSGVNGYKYEADRFVEKAVAEIVSIWRDDKRYVQLAESSHAEYANRLNWPAGAALLRTHMTELVSGWAYAS